MKLPIHPRAVCAGVLLVLTQLASGASTPSVGTLENVAELPIRPGNVSVTADGRVFATVHPFDTPSGLQLIEVTGRAAYKAWPSQAVQSNDENRGADRIDTPLGITQDTKGRLWITDMGLNLGKTRLWGFDIASGKMVKRIDLPAEHAPKGSFVQDLVVDASRGWIYLADINNPALLAVRIDDGKVRRFEGHPSLQSEDEATLRVGGKQTYFKGEPAKVGVNPLTLSSDGATLYFGAMTGTRWYALPTRLLREGSDAELGAAIELVGRKPLSDGAATDKAGNHFFTNLNDDGIDMLDTQGKLAPLVRDPRLSWPDSVQFGPRSWLYISVNQLHKTDAFTGKGDQGSKPYRIMRVWTGTPGQAPPLPR
jgi:sugar lactone lactonase YvrE